MNTDVRLLLTGGMTVLAGWLADSAAGNTTMAVGSLIVGVAVYQDLIALAAQPLYVVTNRPPPGSKVARGGLGAQKGTQGRRRVG